MTQTTEDGEVTNPQMERRSTSPPACGAVYGLGLIGALFWFWRQADGVGGHVSAMLKAMVWPAFLVYEAFRALRQLDS